VVGTGGVAGGGGEPPVKKNDKVSFVLSSFSTKRQICKHESWLSTHKNGTEMPKQNSDKTCN